jgi:hypothetical protein
MTTKQRNITITVALAILLVILFFKKKKLDPSVTYSADGNDDKNRLQLGGRKAVFSTPGGQKTSSDIPEFPNTGYMEVYLELQNNSNQTQPVTLFDAVNKYNQQGLYGSTFSYDFTTALANAAITGATSVVVNAQPNVNAPYQAYSYNSGAPITTVTAAVNALNNVGIGTFTNPSGNTVTYNSKNYFLGNISITNTYVASATPNTSYTSDASFIYDIGFQQNGSGRLSLIPTTNLFWRNAPANLVSGPMNRNAVWNAGIPLNQFLGTNIPVFMPQAGIVYIGLGSDNIAQVYVNGTLTILMNPVAMQASIASQYPAYAGVLPVNVPLVFWNIYPISLPYGNSSIIVQNSNTGSVGALAVEVYNNTAAEIAAATSYGDLNMLFQSSSLVGSNLY